MDIREDKDFAALPEVAKLYQACKERDLTIAEREYLKGARDAWQAAQAQAVPDTYTPIVLALEDVQSKIAQASFLTMGADNENEVYAVDANELHEYIAELIEAQEPAND